MPIRNSKRRPTAIWLTFVVLVCISKVSAQTAPEASDPAAPEAEVAIPPGSGSLDEVIGCELDDGTVRLVSVTPAEMPWRVEIGMPKSSPKFGSMEQGRNAAIIGMRPWARAIQSMYPWFELEFVKKDRDAPVRIKWKRRTTGSAQGRAGPVCRTVDGELRAGGAMEIAVESCPTCSRLTVDEIELLLAHEFGHILGLGHCLDCDSAMNYSWQTEGRVHVTQVDVDAVVRRFELAYEGAEASSDTEPPVGQAEPPSGLRVIGTTQ